MLNDQDLRDNKPDLATTLTAVQNGQQGTVSATVFYGLSRLNTTDIKQIQPVWDGLDPDYRRKLLRRLVDVSEANFDLDYHIIGMMALKDADAEVREAGVDLLFEDMSIELMDRLIEMAQWDDSAEVRAAAASALGRFILAGELEELPERETARAQDVAVNLLSNEDESIDVRRRALEAISNSSHEIVEEAIRDAYDSYDHKMRVSSVFAMGRSCDPQWGSTAMMRSFNTKPPVPQANLNCAKLYLCLYGLRSVLTVRSKKWQYGHWVKLAAEMR
jgi:hypothetical protein